MKTGPGFRDELDKSLKLKLAGMLVISAVFHTLLIVGVALAKDKKPDQTLKDRSITVKMFSPPKIKKSSSRPAGHPRGQSGAPSRVTPPPKAAPQKAPPPPKVEKKEEHAKTQSGTESALKPQSKPETAKKVIPKDATETEIKKSEGSRGVDDEDVVAMNSRLAAIRNKVKSREESGIHAQWVTALGEIRGSAQAWSYYDQVKEIYSQAMSTPPSVPRDQGLEVRVIVWVNQYGTVMNFNVVQLSINETFNYMVINTIRSIKELGQVPYPVDTGGYPLPLSFEP